MIFAFIFITLLIWVQSYKKKVVVTKRFWEINAIRPKIKAIKGKTRKFNLGQKANWGGLVKHHTVPGTL